MKKKKGRRGIQYNKKGDNEFTEDKKQRGMKKNEKGKYRKENSNEAVLNKDFF